MACKRCLSCKRCGIAEIRPSSQVCPSAFLPHPSMSTSFPQTLKDVPATSVGNPDVRLLRWHRNVGHTLSHQSLSAALPFPFFSYLHHHKHLRLLCLCLFHEITQAIPLNKTPQSCPPLPTAQSSRESNLTKYGHPSVHRSMLAAPNTPLTSNSPASTHPVMSATSPRTN